jgi:hypothetical protein
MLVWGFNQCTMVSSWYLFSFRCDLVVQPFMKIYSKECDGNNMMMDTPAHLQHMNVSMTLCINLDWMWEAFHAGLGHEPMLHGIISHSGATWDFQPYKNFLTKECEGKSMMMDIAVHLQHINVVKYSLYILRGCGKHSMLVWCLNQCTMVSFLIQVRLRFSATYEFLDQGVSW